MNKSILTSLCLSSVIAFGANFKMKNGDMAIAYKIDTDTKTMTVLASTAYDPKTDESQSNFTLKWTDKTLFQRRVEGIDFTTITPGRVALFYLDAANRDLVKDGKPFKCQRIEFQVQPQKPGWSPDGIGLRAPFFPTGKSTFEVEVDGKRVKGSGNGIEFFQTAVTEIKPRIDALRLWVKDVGDDQVLTLVEIRPQEDERKDDDRSLPSVLVVGDSISMNYNAAAKALMKGKFNYHRIPANGGPSTRGLACLAMWLGDYANPASKWDVVVLNHGLHDLLQDYNLETKAFGDKHRIEPAEYAANIRRELKFLAKTGLKLVWVMTTPVPNDGHAYGNWGRHKDEELKYNEAVKPVLAEFPQVVVCDLNAVVRNSPVFDEWRKGNNVHFKPGSEQETLAKAVTDAIIEAYGK